MEDTGPLEAWVREKGEEGRRRESKEQKGSEGERAKRSEPLGWALSWLTS